MKSLLFLIIVTIAVFTTSSCTKCVKCTEKSANDSLIVEYPETCGNWRVIADFEERVHAQALKESKVICVPKSKIPFMDSY